MTSNNIFKLTLPSGWKETTVYTFEGPYDSGVQHNLVLSILPELPENVALAQYVQSQMEVSAESLPGFELISEKELTVTDIQAGYETVFRYQPSDDVRYMQKQWYFVIKDKIYLFTATFSKKTLKTIGTEVETIVRSLQTDLINDDE